jgi:anti-sigma B factor antagonist
MLDLTTTIEENRTIVRARGEIDAATCDDLSGVLTTAVGSRGDVELDVSGVTFIDSSGLRALVLAQQQLAEGRTLYLRKPDATFRRLLGITGLDELFSVVE